MTGPLPPITERFRFEPVQSSSVLSAFSLSRFAAIQWSMSVMHCWSRIMADSASSRRQCTYHCVSSANAWSLTPCSSALSASSAVYNTNSRGPRTDPCGTEQTTHITLSSKCAKNLCNLLSKTWSHVFFGTQCSSTYHQKRVHVIFGTQCRSWKITSLLLDTSISACFSKTTK